MKETKKYFEMRDCIESGKNYFEIINTKILRKNEYLINNKINILQEQKNNFMIERSCSTNQSTNKNENFNIINKNNVNINEAILNNYINSMNIGYKSNYDKNILDPENSTINNNIELECEPIPSFVLCVTKMNNKS